MQKLIKTVLIPIFFILSVAAFVSCKKAEDILILPPENIRVENDYLFWDEALHAEWYLVDIDGTEYEADTNSLSLFEITTEPKSSYQIRIKSCGDETVNYKKSEWSALCDYQREKQPFLFQSINNNTEYQIKAVDPESLNGSVILPAYINNKPITKIMPCAFKNAVNVTAVKLPYTIAEIGNSAFYNCTGLQRIELPDGLKEIPFEAFRNCAALTEINLPRVTKISTSAFYNCSSLTSLHIPQSVREIGNCITAYCKNLTSLTVDENNLFYESEGNCIIKKSTHTVIAGCIASAIPQSAKTIGSFAFYGSVPEPFAIPSNIEKLERYALSMYPGKTLVIPESVTYLHYEFIDYYPNLTQITVAENNPVYRSEGNCIIEKATGTVVKGCNTSVIPQGVKAIGERAFYNIPQKEINLPDSVTEIGSEAFYPCTAENIRLSRNLEIIGYKAFAGAGITSVDLPDTLKEIRDRAFKGCHSLAEAALPHGLTKIGSEAFFETNLQYADIPETVKEIGTNAFASHSFLTVILPSCVEKIGNAAFINAITFVNATKRECKAKSGWAIYTIKGTASPWHNSNAVYECTFADDENGKYLYSWKYTIETDEETGEISYSSGFGAVGIPFRKGYRFLGFSATEGSSVPDIVPTMYLEKYLDAFDFQQLKNYKNGTVFYSVWEASDTAEE